MFQRLSIKSLSIGLGSLLLYLQVIFASSGLHVTCDTGRCFALALANSSVDVVSLIEDVYIADNDWQGLPAPVVLSRNFTVTSGPGHWRTLDFRFVTQKVQLRNGATLAFTAVVLHHARRRNASLNPGLDLLLPSPPPLDNMTDVVLFEGCTMTLRACYPQNLSVLNLAPLPRSAGFPGKNRLWRTSSPPGTCRNDSDTPLYERCWSDLVQYDDVATDGVDLTDNGIRVRTQYVVRVVNSSAVCLSILSFDCINALTPAGCMAQALSAPQPALLTSPSAVAAPAAASDKPASGPHVLTPIESSADRKSGNGGGAGGESPLPALLGGLLGGLVGLGALLLAAVVVRNRRRRGRPQRPGAPSGADCLHKPSSTVLDCPITVEGGEAPFGGSAGMPAGGAEATGVATAKPLLSPSTMILLHMWQPEESARGGDPAAQYSPGNDDPTISSALVLGKGVPGGQPANGVTGEAMVVRPMVQGAGTVAATSELVSPRILTDTLFCDGLTSDSDGTDHQLVLEKRTLGKGAHGHVVVGWYRGEQVAVKLMRHVLLPQTAMVIPAADNTSNNTSQHHLAQSLFQEVEVLGRCRHPNVVRLLAANLAPPRPCLVMELMETSLQAVLYGTPGSLLPFEKVLHITIEVARGLEYLHPTVVHRDIKPANVLINEPNTPRPVVKLTDFGLSRLRITEAPTVHPDVGTPAYMAPECFDSTNFVITHKADIFSLGVLLAEMLAGRQPWLGSEPLAIACAVTIRGGRPFALHHMPPSRCPPKLKTVILGCWERDPRRRPAAAELAKSLAVILEQLSHPRAAESSSGQ